MDAKAFGLLGFWALDSDFKRPMLVLSKFEQWFKTLSCFLILLDLRSDVSHQLRAVCGETQCQNVICWQVTQVCFFDAFWVAFGFLGIFPARDLRGCVLHVNCSQMPIFIK